MDGQLFGKLAQLAYKSLSRHVASGGGRLSDRTRARLRFIRDHIQSGKPRVGGLCGAAPYTLRFLELGGVLGLCLIL